MYYIITWFGADGSYHEDEKETFEDAQEWAVYIEEHGGWNVSIEECDDNE